MMIETPPIRPLLMPEVRMAPPLVSPDLPREQMFAKTLLAIHSGTVLPGAPPLKLRSDIFASIDWTKDGVVISSCLFDEDGYGRTYEDAWHDFIASLRDKHASLKKREATLSPEDRRVLDALRSSLTAS